MERVAELCFRSRDGTAALEAWLAGGANPDERDSLGNTMFSGIVLSSPYREQVERVRILIKYGASVDLECSAPPSWSPLHLCAMQQNHACMALLLDAGADIDKVAPNGTTPLMAAATRLKTIIVLRQLVLRGRATPPHALVKLFADSTPKEIVWRVLKFWRSDREPLLPPVEHSGYPPSGHHDLSDIY